jgi:hypothetical protein
VARLHTLLHDTSAAVAKTLDADADVSAIQLQQLNASLPSSVSLPSSFDVKSCGQNLQFVLRDVMAFSALAHAWCSKGSLPQPPPPLPPPTPQPPPQPLLPPPSSAQQPKHMFAQPHPCPVFSHPSFTLDSGSNSAAVEGPHDPSWGASPAYRYVLGTGTYNAVVAAIQSEAVAKGIAAVGGAGVSGATMIIFVELNN